MNDLLAKLEIDIRLVGMVAALGLVWIGFDYFTGGLFLTPRNLWNLSVQTASIATMSCGMVLVIVTRSIDLSVGSILGFAGMIVGVVQARFLPVDLGWGYDNHWIWLVAVLAGLGIGGLIGTIQGFIIAYLGVSSFIVTLGGLLVWRGAAWWVTQGQTVAPIDARFQMLGGGIKGSVGAPVSWAIGIVTTLLVIGLMLLARRRRIAYGFSIRPAWSEAAIYGVVAITILGVTWIFNAYYIPVSVARRIVEASGQVWPEGGVQIAHGYAIPVLIAIVAGILVSFLAIRTRFGRYLFAIGGNPEAAELSGIRTRRTQMLVFTLMGVLCGLAACISTARLQSATNATGTFDELYVIAATVIGGTSLAGGVGTIHGAMLGAVLMGSLQSGMLLLDMPTPLQNIVVGCVLVLAVWVDGVFRRRVG
ncbi:sugar ABC transporter permease [Ferrovibrio sp.]|uniref:sugar ABC transporter permease n=1 Tax=Ferrovibrio sp. TaxID=1917215 RepID=UPI000CC8E705|nr:sugar ABC transporter permease [Ferrovibrio sp.]PJI42396.1 MAG: sugar ABC transporter permease [Ferrovibrio sp.]